VIQRTCPTCSKTFVAIHGNTKYCSATCSTRSRWIARAKVLCSVCSKPTGYPAGTVEQATHKACRSIEWEHGTRKGYRERGCRCEECSEWSRTSQRDYMRRRKAGEFDTPVCSTAGCERQVQARGLCGMHLHRLKRAEGSRQPSDQWTTKRKANWHKRRAIIRGERGAASESIDVEDVFQRDGWICQICLRPVSQEAKWPDVMCASLDHRIPLARGGSHTYTNVQLAHFVCNSRKGSHTN